MLAYDPPRRLSLTWQIRADYTVDADPARGSIVDVRFTAEGERATRVDLVHHGFGRHGPGGGAVRASVGSEGGWALVLDLYRQSAG